MFRRLFSVDEAKMILQKSFRPRPVGIEDVLILDAHNRVLATDVVSPLDIPPFNRSTVDGYAVNASDTFGADETHSTSLRLIGRVKIGELPKVKITKGTAAEIVTGAPIPEGADSAVMIEYTERRENTVLVRQSVALGENIMKAGSDIRKGETVLKKSALLGPYEIGALSAIGLAKVAVYKRPSVAVFSTGAELVEPGRELKRGKIFDINAYGLSAAIVECGCQPLMMGIVQDEKEEMTRALKKALSEADMVMTSGGVSVGPTDVIPKVLDILGKPGIIIYGIAIKPGKPTAIAVVKNKPVFSLPGHPASALLIFHLFVRPLLIRMTGRQPEPPLIVKALTSTRLFSARGRRTYVTVTLKRDKKDNIIASPVPTGLSGAVTTLSKAHGFTVVHESQQFIEKGQVVEVELLRPDVYYSLMSSRSWSTEYD
jgi:molybdenum cofactor synthesis domain-containing protein